MESGEPRLRGKWRRATSQHFTIISSSTTSCRPWVFLTLILWVSSPSDSRKREQPFSCPPAQVSSFIHPLLFPYLFPFLTLLSNFFSIARTCVLQGTAFEPPPKLMTREAFKACASTTARDCKYEQTHEKLALCFAIVFSPAAVFKKRQNDAWRKSTSAHPCQFFTTEELWPALPSRAVQVVLKKSRQRDKKNMLIKQSLNTSHFVTSVFLYLSVRLVKVHMCSAAFLLCAGLCFRYCV